AGSPPAGSCRVTAPGSSSKAAGEARARTGPPPGARVRGGGRAPAGTRAGAGGARGGDRDGHRGGRSRLGRPRVPPRRPLAGAPFGERVRELRRGATRGRRDRSRGAGERPGASAGLTVGPRRARR